MLLKQLTTSSKDDFFHFRSQKMCPTNLCRKQHEHRGAFILSTLFKYITVGIIKVRFVICIITMSCNRKDWQYLAIFFVSTIQHGCTTNSGMISRVLFDIPINKTQLRPVKWFNWIKSATYWSSTPILSEASKPMIIVRPHVFAHIFARRRSFASI